MKKHLYRKPIRKGKDIIFYVCRIGKSNISIIIKSEESLYWRIRDNIQELVDLGSFDSHFTRGQVFVERVAKFPKDKLTEKDRLEIVEKIKRNFHAIAYEELCKAFRNKTSTLEHFMTDDNVDDFYCDVENLKKVLPLKEVSKEEWFFHALSSRFPEMAKKLNKEHKMLADTMEFE